MPLIQIKIPPQICASRNPMGFMFYALNTNWRNVPTYKVVCTVSKETYYRSGVYEEIVELQTRPNEDDFVVFDLSDILATLVPEAKEPAISTVRVVKDVNQRYEVIFKEVGIGAQLQPTFTDYHIVKAGRSELRGQSLNRYIDNRLFLTNQPRVKPTTPYAPEYLSLGISMTTAAAIGQLKAVVLYSDGSESSAASGPSIAFEPGDILQFHAGYNMLGLQNMPLPAGVEVVGYKLWVEETSGSTAISETQEYRFDSCHCTPFTRYFCFENTFGAIDTIITQGKATTKMMTSSQQAERLPDPFRTRPERTIISFGIRHRLHIEQPIGYQTADDQLWLMELLRSETAWRVGDSYMPNIEAEGAWIPIIVAHTDQQIHQDNEFLNPLSFSYEDAIYQTGI